VSGLHDGGPIPFDVPGWAIGDALDRLEALAADAGEAVATFVWRSALRDAGE